MPEEGEAVALARFINDEAIMLASEDELREAVHWVREVYSAGPARTRLLDALLKGPASASSRGLTDLVVLDDPEQTPGDSAGLATTFARLYRDPAVEDLLRQHRPDPKAGSSRQRLYEAWIEPLATCAQKVVLADPWLTSAAFSRQRDPAGAVWLVAKLVAAGVPQIELLTVHSSPDTACRLLAQEFSGRLGNKLRRSGCRIRLLVAPQSRKFHDRHLRFVFHPQRASISIALGNGGSVFDRDELQEAYHIQGEPSTTAHDREERVRRCQSLAESWITE